MRTCVLQCDERPVAFRNKVLWEQRAGGDSDFVWEVGIWGRLMQSSRKR